DSKSVIGSPYADAPPIGQYTFSSSINGVLVSGSQSGFTLAPNCSLVVAKSDMDDNIQTTTTSFGTVKAYPNPSSLQITFNIIFNSGADNVSLEVFNAVGQKVAEIYRGAVVADMEYTLPFDAGNLPSGTYYYRLNAPDDSKAGKIMIIK